MPFNLRGQSLTRLDFCPVAQSDLGFRCISRRSALVTRSCLIARDFRGFSDYRTYCGESVIYRDLPGTSDIEDLARRKVVERQPGAAYAVGDMGYRSDLLTVAVDGDGPVIKQRLDESVIGHIGSLPRAVYGEISKDHPR